MWLIRGLCFEKHCSLPCDPVKGSDHQLIPRSGQEWNCLSHEVGLGCTVGQSFSRVIMSKTGQSYSLPRRDRVQPCVSELGCQEISRVDLNLFVCVCLFVWCVSLSDLQC